MTCIIVASACCFWSTCSLAGARAATVATPLITRQALFQQAGIIAVANLGELLDTAALLAAQPVPAGNRVGVVSNTRGAVVLAADACADAGLQVASLAAGTQRELRDLKLRFTARGRWFESTCGHWFAVQKCIC